MNMMNIKKRPWIDASNTLALLSTAKDIKPPVLGIALLMRWWDIPTEAWTPYLIRINEIRKLSGTPFTVKWNKSNRLAFTRWMSGHPLQCSEVKLQSDGFPHALRKIKPWCSSDRGKALVLTMLSWSRFLQLDIPISTDSITSPYTGEWSVENIDVPVRAFLRWAGNTSQLRIKPWTWWHLTTKAGPNGHAMTSWLSDLTVINKEDIEAFTSLAGSKIVGILSHLKFLSQNTGATEALKSILNLSWKERPVKAKVVWIRDKELKMRSIGIGCYWYQSALKGIHDSLMNFLERVPEDITFHQGDALKVLRKPEGHSYWSLDLTNATDRFPLWFQQHVLACAFSPEIAKGWAHLIRSEFSSKRGNLKYEVGQPIGYYSSWAAFAVSHHFVVYIAAKRAGLRSHRGLYVLLGDDIVICHDDLAREYKYIILKLGVELSESKTHRSAKVFEFAKRWYNPEGDELSPFPVGAAPLKAKYTDLVGIEITASEKGWTFNEAGFYSQLNGILWGNLGDQFIDRSQRFLNLYHAAAMAAQGKGSWESVLRQIDTSRRSISSVPVSLAQRADDIVRLTLRVLFVTKGLGSLAVATQKGASFIANLMAPRKDNPFKGIAKILINLPQVHVYSQMVEEFSKQPQLNVYKSFTSSGKDKMVSLMVTDLDTLMTSRSQQVNWAVLSKTVRALSIAFDRMSQEGVTFSDPVSIPSKVIAAILKPLGPEDAALAVRYIDPDDRLSAMWERGVATLQVQAGWDPTKAKGYSVFRRLNYLTSEGKVSSYLYGESG